MKKREFQAMLDQSGSSLMKAAADLGVAKSTVSRWTGEIPGYAHWYAAARLMMTPAQRTAIDRQFRGKEVGADQRTAVS